MKQEKSSSRDASMNPMFIIIALLNTSGFACHTTQFKSVNHGACRTVMVRVTLKCELRCTPHGYG